MKENPTALEIKDALVKGEINHEQAITLFKKNTQVATKEPAQVAEYLPPRPSQGVLVLQRIGGELFNHNNADQHYEQRMDLEEGIRHAVGMPIYGAIAAVDAVVDAASFGITEIVEDATFLASRTIYRAKDGWQRGKIK